MAAHQGFEPQLRAADGERARAQNNQEASDVVVAATPYVTPTPYYQPDITPTPQAEVEKDARHQTEREQQWADQESDRKVASAPTPTPARLRMESAEADLNRAWQSLTSQQRAQLNQEERSWIRHRDSLPVEERIKSTTERGKYIWSFVERTFDN
jgi:uncharacterized protein YecT (DUF1311 family)